MALTEILDQSHRIIKKDFNCGKALLDNYLKTQASQDIKRNLAACYVSVDKESGLIRGYYTLSSNSIPSKLVPEKFKNHLPDTYTSIPAILLGRLAVDSRFQGRGTGPMLLIDALSRSFELSRFIGSFAVAVDPLDTEAEGFYAKYGFIQLPDSRKMFLPMKTIDGIFRDSFFPCIGISHSYELP